MRTFRLRGIAEGLVGQSTVTTSSVEDLFARFPALAGVRDKLTVTENAVTGYAACDG